MRDASCLLRADVGNKHSWRIYCPLSRSKDGLAELMSYTSSVLLGLLWLLIFGYLMGVLLFLAVRDPTPMLV